MGDLSEIMNVLLYALIIIIGVVSSVLDYQKKNKNKKKSEQPAPAPKPEKHEKIERPRRYPKKNEDAEILITQPPRKPAVKKAPPAPAKQPKYDDTLAYIIDHCGAENTRKTAKAAPAEQEPAEQEHTLALKARNGIVWSEILQPPVSMR
jgi:cell division protein FtsN